MLLMAGEVIVCAVCNAPKLAPAEREQILNIRRRLGVEGELLLAVVAQADVRFVQTEVQKPVFAEILPVVEPVEIRAWLAEEFALHLLKLANTENEVARGNLISEALAHLTNAERHLLARGALNAREVDKMPCAVSGRRYSWLFASSVTPWNVLNIRLNWRMSVKLWPPHSGQAMLLSAMNCCICSFVQPSADSPVKSSMSLSAR